MIENPHFVLVKSFKFMLKCSTNTDNYKLPNISLQKLLLLVISKSMLECNVFKMFLSFFQDMYVCKGILCPSSVCYVEGFPSERE